jgi:hypothetical protein
MPLSNSLQVGLAQQQLHRFIFGTVMTIFYINILHRCMTFWAIDKFKNITKLGLPQNVRNIGSKLASYVVSGYGGGQEAASHHVNATQQE